MKKITFLLIDENAANRTYYKDLLERSLKYPHQIMEAGSGQDALTILKEKDIDYILLDYQLSDTDGLSLLNKIKITFDNSPHIIFFTPTAKDRKLATQAIKAGAKDFLVKDTTNPERFINTVSKLVHETLLSKKNSIPIQTRTLYGAGLLTTLFGMLFIYAWIAHITPLIQLAPSLPPIKLNAAIELFLAGFGMLTYKKFPRLTLAIGFIIFLIGSLSLIESIFSINIGLDEFFMPAYLDTNTAYPGRLAPNAALYFSLAGIILLLQRPLVTRGNWGHLKFILSVFLTLSGFCGIFGYLTHLPIMYGWGNWGQMSLQSEIGLIILGMGFTTFFRFESTDKHKKKALLPDAIVIFGSLLFILLWQSLVNDLHSWSIIISLVAELFLSLLLAFVVRILQRVEDKSIALQNSEAKFRMLLNSTSDVMLIVNARGEIVLANLTATTLFAYTLEEILTLTVEDLMPERFREMHQIYRDTYMKYPTTRMMGATKNLLIKTKLDQEIPVEIGLNPVQFEEEQCVLCSIHDMRNARESENKLIQQSHSIQAMLDITNAIAKEESFEKAMQHCLTIICTSFQWQIGHVYLVEEDNPDKLIPSPIWYFSEPEKFNNFYNATMKTNLSYTVGLPGRVLAEGVPVWIEDICQINDSPRLEACKASNIHSAFAFAIKQNTQTIGILEFFFNEKRTQDNNFLRIIAILSNQINRFLEYQTVQIENKNLASRFQFAIHAGEIGVWEWDLHTSKLHWDEQMFIVYGRDPKKFGEEYHDWEICLHPDDKKRAVADLKKAVKEQKAFDSEFRIITENGEVRYIEAKATILFSDNGIPKSLLGLNWDITKNKQLTAELLKLNETLEHYAYYDSLTGLMNRHAFHDAANRLLAQAKRRNLVLGVLFIDLDNFKDINDSLGHAAGDQVLIETAKRINKTLRGEDLICRLGGDEFAVVLNDIKSLKAETIAAKLLNNLKQVFKIKTNTIQINASIGISIYPDSGETIPDLLNKADKMLLKSKNEGRGKYNLYSKDDGHPSD